MKFPTSTPMLGSIYLCIQGYCGIEAFVMTAKRGRVSFSCQNDVIFSSIEKKPIKNPVFLMSMDDENLSPIKAEDGDALQSLFEQFCDDDGLMTKSTLLKDITSIRELLELGDLLQDEFDEIWNKAPKFPDLDNSSQQRIDVDSFIQIYRDIDDIFEDDEDDATSTDSKPPISSSINKLSDTDFEILEENSDPDSETPSQNEQILEQAFQNICDSNSLVSKQALLNWSEIQGLLDDGLLGEDEFDSMWEQTTKSPGSSDVIDVDGFLSFNVALDNLFDFDDIDEPSEDIGTIPMYYADDSPPGVIFAEISNDNNLIGMKELRSWGDLQEMLREGDLLISELQDMYDRIPKVSGTNSLDKAGFESLFDSIYALFEDEEQVNDQPFTNNIHDDSVNLKNQLLDLIQKLANDGDKLPCGLEDDETQAALILDRVLALEAAPSNKVSKSDTEIRTTDLAGKWQLLYTTSSTMKFNKGLSGLVPIGTGKFVSLTQSLVASKYLQDLEYVEKIAAGPTEFEVKVNGAWELKSSVSLFTGSKSVALSVEPDKVSYWGPTIRADHWKSLGPLNLLDIAYLDNDLRIMRGTTAISNVFIFKRV